MSNIYLRTIMAVKKKFYVVWSGLKPGIYDNWEDCKKQVVAVTGARYKSYSTLSDAEKALKDGYVPVTSASKSKEKLSGKPNIILPSISVDAACSGNPGLLEYQAINNQDGKVIFRMGPFKDGTNNIGEFLAIVHALAFLNNKNFPTMPIYSDSSTAIGWVKKKKANTKLDKNHKNAEVFDLIERAEKWLSVNSYSNPIYKWETEKWGENPADFGRK